MNFHRKNPRDVFIVFNKMYTLTRTNTQINIMYREQKSHYQAKEQITRRCRAV